MTPFNYRLEQVLRYRKQLEETAILALAKAEERRVKTREHIARIESESAKLVHEKEKYASLEPGERYVLVAYEQALRAEKESALIRLAQQELEVDARRQELVKKAQERSLLDKLKEKQAKRHAVQELLHEQRTNDETATLRFSPAAF
jgi:flagellar export protein FliJ